VATYGELVRVVSRACEAIAAGIRADACEDPVVGFALQTDDNVSTIFGAIVRSSFVEQEGEESLYIAVDWPVEDFPGARLLEDCSGLAAVLSRTIKDSETAFRSLVDALLMVRGDFPRDIFLGVMSTDPSDQVEEWELEGVARLNSPRHLAGFRAMAGVD
jgi:hypothetical protein